MTTEKKHPHAAQSGDRIEVTIKGIVGWASESYVEIKTDDGKSITLTNKELTSTEVVVKPAMPKWQDGDVVIGYDAAMTNDGVFRRHDGKWVNELLKTDPRGLDDEYIEIGVDERGYRILVAEGRPVLPAPEGEVPHEFESTEGSSGMACTALVTDREGHGTDCGMPASDPIHHGGKP